MNNTIQLYMDENEEIEGYPITSPDRVIDENGITIKEQLDNIKKQNYGVVSPQMFKLNSDIDDTLSIQRALDSGAIEVKFGNYNYIVSQEIIIPDNVLVNLENCTISAKFDNGYILKTKHYTTTKPTFKMKGNRAVIGGYKTFGNSSNLHGLYIDSCNFSTFGGFVVQNCEYPVTLAPYGDRDIININLYDIETNTRKSLRMLSGLVNGIDYQEITVGKISNCFWSCIGENSKSLEIICNNHSDGSVSSIFGLDFDTCSFNPTHINGGTQLSLLATGKSSIYNITFNNCEGELRGASLSPTMPMIEFQNVNDCKVDFKGWLHKSNGIKLVNSSRNTFYNLVDGNINSNFNGKLLDIDSNSYGNNFYDLSCNLNQISTERGVTNAPLSSHFWNRIQDLGTMNNAYGMISSYVKRVFSTKALQLLNGNKFANSCVINRNSTVIYSNNEYTITTDNTGIGFTVDSSVPINSKVYCRIKYKFIRTSVTGWRISNSSRNVDMKISTSYVEQIFETTLRDRTFSINSTVVQSNTQIVIAEFEVFTGGFPYYPNVSPIDVVENSKYFKTSGTTIERPTNAPIGYMYFDSTLGKSITFTGSLWKDGNGTTV